jgi:hypothetical protein
MAIAFRRVNSLSPAQHNSLRCCAHRSRVRTHDRAGKAERSRSGMFETIPPGPILLSASLQVAAYRRRKDPPHPHFMALISQTVIKMRNLCGTVSHLTPGLSCCQQLCLIFLSFAFRRSSVRTASLALQDEGMSDLASRRRSTLRKAASSSNLGGIDIGPQSD